MHEHTEVGTLSSRVGECYIMSWKEVFQEGVSWYLDP